VENVLPTTVRKFLNNQEAELTENYQGNLALKIEKELSPLKQNSDFIYDHSDLETISVPSKQNNALFTNSSQEVEVEETFQVEQLEIVNQSSNSFNQATDINQLRTKLTDYEQL